MSVPTSSQGAESKRWLVPLLANSRRVVGPGRDACNGRGTGAIRADGHTLASAPQMEGRLGAGLRAGAQQRPRLGTSASIPGNSAQKVANPPPRRNCPNRPKPQAFQPHRGARPSCFASRRSAVRSRLAQWGKWLQTDGFPAPLPGRPQRCRHVRGTLVPLGACIRAIDQALEPISLPGVVDRPEEVVANQ